MHSNQEIEIRSEIKQLVKGYVLTMVIATTVTVVGGLFLYWYLEDRYLNLSPLVSHIFAVIFVGLAFHIVAHTSFIFYFNTYFQNPRKRPQWLAELDNLNEKVRELEHQLVLVRARTPHSKDAHAVEKNHIVLRERDFIDQLKQNISQIQAMVREGSFSKGSDIALRIGEIRVELMMVMDLIEKNREYLLIAA